MAITLSGQADSTTAASTTGVVTINPSAGELIVVEFVMRNGTALSSVTDNRGQTYVAVTTPVAPAARAGIYYFPNCAAGSTTITVTATGADTISVNASHWAGALTTSPLLDFDTNAGGAGTSHPCGTSGVDAVAGDLIVTVSGQNSTITDEVANANYTALSMATGGNGRQFWQYRLVNTTVTADTATYTASSHGSGSMMAVFGQAAAAGSIVPIIHHYSSHGKH